jgi:hypothetical protein
MIILLVAYFSPACGGKGEVDTTQDDTTQQVDDTNGTTDVDGDGDGDTPIDEILNALEFSIMVRDLTMKAFHEAIFNVYGIPMAGWVGISKSEPNEETIVHQVFLMEDCNESVLLKTDAVEATCSCEL